MSTICVLYGFGEGPRVGRRLVKALTAKGHDVVVDPAGADVIITHSGGCLLLPSEIRAKQIIHVAPYYWPNKSWFACMSRKLLDDLQTHHAEGDLHFWAHKTFWNFVYFWRMSANFKMMRRLKGKDRWRHGEITAVVRPRFDTFCIPEPKSLPYKPSAVYISMPGSHDDCWRDPAPYISLIQS